MLQIVGAGFGRTGTLSLKQALETLGFARCYHMTEVLEHPEHTAVWQAAHDGKGVDWDSLLEGYRATVDWPACNFWRELALRYPEAKVLLTTRDPDSWWQSVMATIYPATMRALEAKDPFGEWAIRLIWTGVFDGRMEDREHAIEVFRRHEELVRSTLPADRLLVYDVAQGWGPLCEFLGCPVPDTEFPHVNTTEEFLAGSRRREPSS